MSETTSTPSNMQASQPTKINAQVGGVQTPTVEAPKNINIVEIGKVVQNIEKTTGQLDTSIGKADANYISKFVSSIGKQTQFSLNQNGDGYNLSGVLNAGQDAISNSFKGQIMRDTGLQNKFNKAQQSFAQMDTQNYRYIHHSVLGNMRVAIDAEGKDIGLPEPVVA